MRGISGWTCGLVILAVGCSAADRKIHSNSYLGKEPPELEAVEGHWLNAKAPPTLKALKGRVVWLEFGFIH